MIAVKIRGTRGKTMLASKIICRGNFCQKKPVKDSYFCRTCRKDLKLKQEKSAYLFRKSNLQVQKGAQK